MLVVSTSYNRGAQDSTIWQLITDFCEKTLKKKPTELSAIYCTVLDVELSEEQKEHAARHGVTLIPAIRPKWSNDAEDPPSINWLFSHANYFPDLRNLNIEYVVALSAKTKNAACALRANLFPEAKLFFMHSKPAALFVGISWNEDELGLTGFHRTLVQDFCERKAKASEYLKVYSTVLDVQISDSQKTDAEKCGVILIPAQRKEGIAPKSDPPGLHWLLLHESYYKILREIENIQYVVGYAPKTGRAAVHIRANVFRDAKLVLINHACPEANCLQPQDDITFEKQMLELASEADLVFSIGPTIFEYFRNAYRAEVNGKALSEIPHEEILPRPLTCFWTRKDPVLRDTTRHNILTCGQVDTQEAIQRCESMAASIDMVANRFKVIHGSTEPPEWKIQGVSQTADQSTVKCLRDMMKTPQAYPKIQPGHSAKSLLTSLQQSHLCLPAPCYVDYSFYGLEALTFGLPTIVTDDSHLAQFVRNHLTDHTRITVVESSQRDLSYRIEDNLVNVSRAFKQAKATKIALLNNDALIGGFSRFASLLTMPPQEPTEFNVGEQETLRNVKDLLDVHIGVDDAAFQQCLAELGEDFKALPAQKTEQKKKIMNKVCAALELCKQALKKRVEEVVADEVSFQQLKKLCKEKVGNGVDPTNLTAGCLAILLRFLTLYNLYRVKQICRCGSLAKVFEPMLITDEMRKIADKEGIKLQLKATYNLERFKEVELFFINRDGGGIQRMEICDVLAEDRDEDVKTSPNKNELKEDAMGRVVYAATVKTKEESKKPKSLFLGYKKQHVRGQDLSLDTTGITTVSPEMKVAEGRQDLFSVICSGNVDNVKSLIKEGSDVNLVDKLRWTPLHYAIMTKSVDIVNVLIKAKADINARDMFDNTPLHMACQYCEVDIVRVLLTHRADINARNNMNELPEETIGSGVHADILMTEEERKTLKAVFREYRKNRQYVALLQEVEEQIICKLFLCGYAKVGKTTLGKSLQKIKSNEQYVPTPGIDVSRAAIPSAGKFSLWDFAGQTEFYVTHNMFLGSGNAVFLLVFGIVDNENDKPLMLKETKEKEIIHWLSFIKATNVVNPQIEGTSPFTEGGKPTVILVASRADMIHEAYMTEADRVLSSIVQSMQKMFGKYLNIHDRVFLLDCRAPGHVNIERLRQCLHQPKTKVPKLCAEMLKHVEAWTNDTSFPVISWNDYRHKMSKLHPVVGEEVIRMATSYLQDMGEILYMKYSDCNDDIIMQPQWLCSDVFGPLFATHSFAKFAKTLERKKFYLYGEIMQIFEEDWDVDRVFRLLEKFEILYEEYSDSSHWSESTEKRYVITGMLDDCMPPSKWQKEPSKEIYYGRRIECHDDTDSFSSGLFPRLQTRLYHTFEKIGRTPSDIWKNGIKVCDEIEGLVYMPKGLKAIQICVRAERREEIKACHNLLDKLMNTIEDVLDISCPGTNVDRYILSSRSLRNHVDPECVRYYTIETIVAAEKHTRRVYDEQFGDEEKLEDLLCVGFDTTLLRKFGYKADIKWMTQDAKQKFAAIMDHKQERRNDYRYLADIVGMKYDEIKCLEEKECSGTQHVLSTWSQKWAEEQHSAEASGDGKEPKKEVLASNFSNLMKVLNHDEMQRDDAVAVIVEMFASLGIRQEREGDS